MSLLTGQEEGVRLQGPVTTLVLAAVANAVTVFSLSAFNQLVGTKSMKITKIKLRNNAAGSTYIHIGTGVGGTFIDLIPALYTINAMSDDYGEGELPSREAFASITAWPEALIGALGIDIQIEVAEIG
ncbi:MAG: hypothetical protein Q8O55_01440 [Dehalococcoidales bacterium]|nr:hypothetical protein [Dehalococcoidales bacterium]